MTLKLNQSEFEIIRDKEKCISCQVCVRQCSNDVHEYDETEGVILSDSSKCVGCHRCETLCPTGSIKIKKRESEFKSNANWTPEHLKNIYKQAETGGVILTGMGCDKPYPVYWDHILFNASQVTNPSIDPLREPMEIKTFIGRKPDILEIKPVKEAGSDIIKYKNNLEPQLEINIPVLFSAMSYGSISLNAVKSLARAASEFGTFYNTGEGGLHKDLMIYADNTIVQVASGRFGVDKNYLNNGAAVEIKIGQGAKPGIGGHLPGEKVNYDVSTTRMIPEGSDAISPAPHHDIYSIEDLSQLIYALKEATEYKKPVGVKVSAVHNIAPIASGIVRAGADFISIDGFRGGTGAAPQVIRDNVGIPIELALSSVDLRLREEGIRHKVSLIVAGSIRSSSDVIKAIALGADAVYIGTAALVALGCHLCQKCYTGKCNWGIATQDPYLTKRLNPEIGTRRLLNLLNAWSHEIKEMLGGAGINAIESLRGNREHLRGVGLNERELSILGIKHAGEAW
ncbi:MAG: glutamate synthase-related protein [Actinobacteria bacterium]|nr:glutamate synthase-related protein [Cyanobacteriota bacterium]MCL5772474.1 glutamate synthase-related protein [Actinomycetota bacterium]